MQRVKDIVSGSRDIQSLFAYENPLLSKLLLEVISPFQADDLMLDTVSEKYLGTMHIKHLPLPRRSTLLQFHFELPAIPWSPMLGSRVRLCFCALMAAILFATTKSCNTEFCSVESWAVFEARERRWLNDLPVDEFQQITVLAGSDTMASVLDLRCFRLLSVYLVVFDYDGMLRSRALGTTRKTTITTMPMVRTTKQQLMYLPSSQPTFS